MRFTDKHRDLIQKIRQLHTLGNKKATKQPLLGKQNLGPADFNALHGNFRSQTRQWKIFQCIDDIPSELNLRLVRGYSSLPHFIARGYPLVNVYITMERSTIFFYGKIHSHPRFLWLFSIANCNKFPEETLVAWIRWDSSPLPPFGATVWRRPTCETPISQVTPVVGKLLVVSSHLEKF